jgi:hypothetical protein
LRRLAKFSDLSSKKEKRDETADNREENKATAADP